MSLIGTSHELADTLINSQRMKAQTMANTIDAIVKASLVNIHKAIPPRIISALAEYKKLSEHRNKVAHWHWMPLRGDTATAQDLMKGDKYQEEEYSLLELKKISFGLINAFTQLKLLETLLTQQIPDFAIELALKQHDEISEKVKEAILSLPALPDEDVATP